MSIWSDDHFVPGICNVPRWHHDGLQEGESSLQFPIFSLGNTTIPEIHEILQEIHSECCMIGSISHQATPERWSFPLVSRGPKHLQTGERSLCVSPYTGLHKPQLHLHHGNKHIQHCKSISTVPKVWCKAGFISLCLFLQEAHSNVIKLKFWTGSFLLIKAAFEEWCHYLGRSSPVIRSWNSFTQPRPWTRGNYIGPYSFLVSASESPTTWIPKTVKQTLCPIRENMRWIRQITNPSPESTLKPHNFVGNRPNNGPDVRNPHHP